MFSKSSIIRLDKIGSTNEYLTDLLRKGKPEEGSVVVALDQTHGKGQENNSWESEAGKNLTASIVLYPTFLPPEEQFILTKVISLSVCSLLDEYLINEKAMIKWPNDIYLGNGKVAGILIRNEIMGNGISGSIAGIGLNLNQEKFSVKAPGAVSLKMITREDYDVDKVLTDWHEKVAFWYDKLLNAEFSLINKRYLERFYLLNQTATYIIKGAEVKATILGIAEYGMLLLADADGKQYKCSLKEVIFPQRS